MTSVRVHHKYKEGANPIITISEMGKTAREQCHIHRLWFIHFVNKNENEKKNKQQ